MLSINGTSGGTITGAVRAEGRKAPEAGSGSGKYDSRKFKFAERVNYAELREFVVYIDQPFTGSNGVPAKPVQITTRRIAQKGAMFMPHVLPVMVGTTVEWPNEDEIYHNVFSVSDAKPFDLGLYKHPEVKRVIFDKAGRVDIFCSIHSAMNCIVLVLESPWFAATDAQGRYVIRDVPAGTYKLKAWHERLPARTMKVTVPETGNAQADFVLGVSNLPQY